MRDRVLNYYHPQAGAKAIQPDELNKLAAYFHEAVVTELQGSHAVVTPPGADVLRICAAITNVVPANPSLNVVTTAVAFVPLDLGAAAIEAKFLDSVTGERLAAMAERKKGSVTNLKRGFTELGHARSARPSFSDRMSGTGRLCEITNGCFVDAKRETPRLSVGQL